MLIQKCFLICSLDRASSQRQQDKHQCWAWSINPPPPTLLCAWPTTAGKHKTKVEHTLSGMKSPSLKPTTNLFNFKESGSHHSELISLMQHSQPLPQAHATTPREDIEPLILLCIALTANCSVSFLNIGAKITLSNGIQVLSPPHSASKQT